MRSHSDRTVHYLVGEGFFTEPGISPTGHNAIQPPHTQPTAAAAPAPGPQDAFKFGRMFKGLKMEASAKEEQEQLRQNLIKLGQAMISAGAKSEDSDIPSGYTYLGQFIAHEITFDIAAVKGLPQSTLPPELLKQGRTPLLDLDSLYGEGPLQGQNPELYQDDGVSLKYGKTTATITYPPIYQNDLPRVGGNGPDKLKAIIIEPRNDENLPVAQLHVALIKFHNQVVAKLKAEKHPQETLFKTARETVVRHFQWIVLRDYLPKIVNKDVLTSVLNQGPKCFLLKTKDALYMPVEFSVAAFRFGHSMVRDFYEWNSLKNSSFKTIVNIRDLFEFGGLRGKMRGARGLPSDWVIDWRRFFEFPDALGVIKLSPAQRGKINKAKKIDTILDMPLQSIPGFQSEITDEGLRSIAVRNLLRGFYLELPTAQAVIAEVLKAIEPEEMRVLTEDEIAEGVHEETLKAYQFHLHTPLWYYILKEGEKLGEGNRLGPLGSRIVAETLYAIILNSETSILRESGWRPNLGDRAPELFEMVDLLKFARTISPIDKGVDA